ncbi:MAG: chloride channel protein [Rubrivivax sp.]|nr:chloride channel protein [Rubrivivax sp.]
MHWPRRLLNRLAELRKEAADTVGAHGEQAPPLRRLLGELAVSHPWIDRGVVLGFAAFTGLAVVAFTWLSELATHGHERLRGVAAWAPLLMLLWTPALTVAVLWCTRRFAPGAIGSGIPQVMRAVEDDITPAQRRWLVSPVLSLQKIGLVSAGLLAGLSIGREGPTVQVGAGLMVGARRWLSPSSRIDEHDLMVAGAAAGIAAAFNTPLGGIVFGLEQLTRRRGLQHSTLVIAAIVLAGLVAVAFFGSSAYFGRLPVQTLSWSLLAPGLMVALVSGLAGGLFARLMVASAEAGTDRLQRWRASYPFRFAAACAAAVALIGLVTGGQTAGAGYAPTRGLLEGQADLPGVYTVLKFCATWLSAWTGVPAGAFAPSLAIGAGIGHDVATLADVGRDAAIPLIALGMAGFLAATTQAPITAFIIVMEMVSGHAMVLSLMACTMVAAGVSRLVSAPMYDGLAALLPVSGAAPAGAPETPTAGAGTPAGDAAPPGDDAPPPVAPR